MSKPFISARFTSSSDFLTQKGLQPGGRVQTAIDNAFIRWNAMYTPFDTGLLANSPYTASKIGYGKIIYPGPAARYLYFGEVMGPNIPVFDDDSGIPTRFFSRPDEKKHLTGRQLTYKTDKSPLAGAFWAVRMKADHIKDILTEARNVANQK